MTHDTAFAAYESQLARSGDRLLLGVLAALLLICAGLAPWHDTWLAVAAIGVPAFVVPAWLAWQRPGARLTRCAIAAALMIYAALQIHQAQGMVEMHFAVFVLLAFTLIYRDWLPIVVAAGTIAVHHVGFDWLQRAGTPVYVFDAGGGFGLVLLHAAYVVFETAILVAFAIRLRAESVAVGRDPRELSRVAQALAAGRLDAARGDGAPATDGARPAPSLADSVTRAADALAAVVRESGAVLQAIAAGDLSRRVGVDAPGEFAALKDSVNSTAEFLARFTAEQATLVRRANAGDFAARVRTEGLRGYQAELATGLNGLAASTERFLAELAEVLGALARGDLSRRMSGEYAGQFDALKRDANATVAHLVDVVQRIQLTADLVREGTGELARGNENLRTRTEEQAASLQQTSSSVAEMTSTVRHNADNAAQASQLAAGARELAERGGDVVGRAVAAMGEISASSRRITDIIGVIDEIAFQTNLLALNAAVEAARAGDQGRGFAVVAAEVRTLAGRSAQAAREIKALIDDSVHKVQDGSRLVDESGRTLGEIVASAKRVQALIAEISAASAEQAGGIEEVNRAVHAMDGATQQNAALVEQSAAATESLNGHAGSLSELVAFFRTARARTTHESPGARSAPPRLSA